MLEVGVPQSQHCNVHSRVEGNVKRLNNRQPDSRESLRRGCLSWEWLVLRVMAALGFAVFAVSPAVLSQTQMETPRSTILVFNYSQTVPTTIRIAEAEASQLLGKSGLQAAWQTVQGRH
jgi:hypothetical protein